VLAGVVVLTYFISSEKAMQEMCNLEDNVLLREIK